MICGIKYCGGCNPRYNRTQFYEKLKKECPEIEFEYVKTGIIYDHLVVINGCLSRCADLSEIQVQGDTFKIADANQFEELIEQLKIR